MCIMLQQIINMPSWQKYGLRLQHVLDNEERNIDHLL